MAKIVHHTIRAKGEIEDLLRLVNYMKAGKIRFGFTIHHDEDKGPDQHKLEAFFDLQTTMLDFDKFGNLIKESGTKAFPIEIYFLYEGFDEWGWVQYFDKSGPVYRIPKEDIINDIGIRLFSGRRVKDEEWTFEHHFPGIPSLFIKSTWTD